MIITQKYLSKIIYDHLTYLLQGYQEKDNKASKIFLLILYDQQIFKLNIQSEAKCKSSSPSSERKQ